MNPRPVVVTEFTLKPGALDAFLLLIKEDVRQLMAVDDACLADVEALIADDDADRVVLRRVYFDQSAIERHRRMPHYPDFMECAASLLDGEPVSRFYQQVICR